MASPNDFFVQPGNDASQALSGLSDTLGRMRTEKARQAERQRLIDEQNAKEQRIQERFTAAKNAAQQALASGNPDEMAKVTLEYPEIGQGLSQAFGIVDADKKQQASSFARNLIANPDQAEQIYQQRIESIQARGGDPKDTIRSYEAFKANPQGELKNLQFMWAAMDKDSYGAFRDEQKAAAKAEADKAKIAREDERFEREEAGRNRRAQMRASAGGAGAGGKQTAHMQDFAQYQELKKTDPEGAKAFGQAAGFVSKEGKELSSHLQKRLSDVSDQAIQAENDIGRYENLANDIERSNFSGGLLGSTWSEALKEATGSQDAVSELRRGFNGLRASQVVNNLPPGAASDTDIALALSGFPSDKANKQQVTSFLRGYAKLQRANADFNNFKADYISQNGSERGMLGAWKEQRNTPARTAPAASSDGWEIVN